MVEGQAEFVLPIAMNLRVERVTLQSSTSKCFRTQDERSSFSGSHYRPKASRGPSLSCVWSEWGVLGVQYTSSWWEYQSKWCWKRRMLLWINCWGGVMWAHLHDLALGSWMGRHFPSTPGTYSHLFKVDEGSRTKESCSSVWILLRWMHRSTMDSYAVVVCSCKEVSDQSDCRMKCWCLENHSHFHL